MKLKVSLDDSITNLDRRRSNSCSSSDSNYNYPNLRHVESHPFKSVEGNIYNSHIKDECGHVKAYKDVSCSFESLKEEEEIMQFEIMI